jgi:hypothetical protein
LTAKGVPTATHKRSPLSLKEESHGAISGRVCLSLCGHFGMAAWGDYTAGEIGDFKFPQGAVDEVLKKVLGMGGVHFPMPN